MNTTSKRWGNSQGVRIPKDIVKSLGIRIGSELTIELSSDHSQITNRQAQDVRPIRGRYRIENLLASSSPDAFEGEHEWGEPCGKEVW